jgi:hypothetical protein
MLVFVCVKGRGGRREGRGGRDKKKTCTHAAGVLTLASLDFRPPPPTNCSTHTHTFCLQKNTINTHTTPCPIPHQGVAANLKKLYSEEGKKLTWWGVSSCTESVNVLESPQFLGKSG